MDYLISLLVLFIIYLVNPFNGEEKTITTPFIFISYIILCSYIFSSLGITMEKFYYLIPLTLIIIFKKPKIEIPKINIYISILIILSIILSIAIFPKYPCDMWDSQYHSYKIKAIVISKTIFYNIDYFNIYFHYPSGFHSLIYFIVSNFKEIPFGIHLFSIFSIVLFVVGMYYLGESVKKGLGLYSSILVLFNMEYYRIILRSLFPNTLGFCIFIFCIAMILRYRQSHNKNYLILLSLTFASMIFTHTFPTLMFGLFLLSIIIYDIIRKNYSIIKEYLKYIIISTTFALIIISSKLKPYISSYSKTIYHDTNVLKVILIAIAGIFTGNIVGFYIFPQISSLLVSLTYFALFLSGCIYLFKNNHTYFIYYVLFMMLWVINLLIGIYIPFYSALYNPIRWYYNFTILSPIFYGAGLYFLKNTNKVISFIILVIIIVGFANSTTMLMYYHNFYLIDDKSANFLKNMGIENKTILNFGQDAGQFIPIFSNNYCTFNYGSNRFNNVSAELIRNYTRSYDYIRFLNFCKKHNISYILLSKNSNINYNFFNAPYFKKIKKCKEMILLNISNYNSTSISQ